ncbi:penicillin-binding protein 2 [candidate division WWE3 bacterium RIFCSPHIGHO2_01_FULL_40_23]|uniref:Penicillin-binding protein 2 n=1 Tax=candidate division WWE3 bacterium RIFCSPLOWO2_01_FULL_41_18 TaxID=1802625 RepID=A0A1F4VEC8_UNCKA|nr:MAG: penicillin-binding protein 2 [candidate division WWE3 bacterium RIFCSPHIGHO2_01_FULL_40_23]OGC55509.1 MAG: penicillin-binding protein 2 [candidate division WWE3 bacterium RIFCSPLOWO2_01_FULL_41_18]
MIQFHEIERITPKRSKSIPKEVIRPAFLASSGWELVLPHLLFVFFMLLLVGRVFYLQVLEGDKNLSLSEGNSIRYSFLRAGRGVIYDRNREVVARNKPGFSIELNTVQCQNSCKDVVNEVSKLVEIDVGYANEQIEKGFTQVTVATNLSRDDIIKVEGRIGNLLGISTQVDPVREYLFPESFAHVLGFIGEGESGDKVGKSGIEKSYEKHLHGSPGSKIIQINSSGTFFTQIAEKTPGNGKGIYLNIDKGLQEVSFSVLKKAVDRKMPKVLNAKTDRATGGAVIATDPKTGGILAFASYPSFNPNLFSTGISDMEFEKLANDPNKPFFNRVVSATYPPGSTFKMVSALAALKSGVINEKSLVDCPGSIFVGGSFFRDWYSGGRGLIDVKRAIQISCDTFFYTVSGGYGVQKGMGIEYLSIEAKKLGFGKELGIDVEGEVKGLFPDPDWKKADRDEDWYLGDTYITSIGQGNILATPLQVNAMTAFFANKGKVYKPYLVKNIEGEPPIEPKLIIEETSDSYFINVVREGMKMVMIDGGTAYPFFDFELKHPDIELAGKTGTAEFGNPVEIGDKTHAWFTVFGPYDDPSIVLTVFLEGGGSGSTDAAPVAREILDYWFK